MAFDPCGTRRLDGDDILARLAVTLNATPVEVQLVLEILIASMREAAQHE